jgi:hypothetical protein
MRIWRSWIGLRRDSLRRIVADVLIVVGLSAIAFAIYDSMRHNEERAAAISATKVSVRTIQAQLDLYVAGESISINDQRFPSAISAEWFDGVRPVNTLLGVDRPWVELASFEELARTHPLDVTVGGGDGAMFWYNPARGIVRARVPRTLTDAEAIRIYNEVNETTYEGPMTATTKVVAETKPD